MSDRDKTTNEDPKVCFGTEDMHRFRSWFESVEDSGRGYLEPADYRLARHIYQVLGWTVPQRVTDGESDV